jgi:prepilin peptidase CpaA
MMFLMLDIGLIFLLALAAWRDVLTRIIPNSIALTIAIIGITNHSTAGWSPFLLSAATAALLFSFLLVLAIRGWLGGGDVKLAAALAIGLPPAATWNFITASVLAGGLLGLGYLAGPHFIPRLRPAGTAHPLARILAVEAWRLRRGGPLPYGVAIAAGGIFVILMGA